MNFSTSRWVRTLARWWQKPTRPRLARRLGVELLEARDVPSYGLGFALGLGGPAGDQIRDIAADAVGNTYAAGTFFGSLDADPSAAEYLLLAGGGGQQAFVAKYDPAGALVWARGMGGTNVAASGVAVDAAGNAYLTGSFTGSADFAGAPLTSAGGYDAFLVKLDAGGTAAWSRGLGTTGSDSGGAVAIDTAGNVFATGGLANFDPAGNDWKDPFVAKYGPDGGQQWLRRMTGTTATGVVGAAAADASGSVFVAGTYQGTIDFDPGPRSYALASLKDKWGPTQDAFVLKLDAAGNFGWAGSVGGRGRDLGNGVAVDGGGNVLLCGSFEPDARNDFDPGKGRLTLSNAGGRDGFVVRFTANRTLVWARSLGGPGDDAVTDVAVDGPGQVYLGGSFSGAVDFDPGAGTAPLVSAGATDSFVTRLSSAGTYGWAGRMGGALEDGGHTLVVDAAGRVYVGGTFRGTADFDPGAGENWLSSTANPDNGYLTPDGFVAKLVPADALHGDTVAPWTSAGAATLGSDQVAPLLAEALRRWQGLGADTVGLGSINVRMADLGGTTLGLASGTTIWLDDDVAGWGWFLDPTPGDDSEFLTPGDQGEQGRIDLLTALMHEVGHLLGHDHDEGGVMHDTLSAGERTKAVTVEVTGDGAREADEAFYLDLFDYGTNSLFTTGRGFGTIPNDD